MERQLAFGLLIWRVAIGKAVSLWIVDMAGSHWKGGWPLDMSVWRLAIRKAVSLGLMIDRKPVARQIDLVEMNADLLLKVMFWAVSPRKSIGLLRHVA